MKRFLFILLALTSSLTLARTASADWKGYWKNAEFLKGANRKSLPSALTPRGPVLVDKLPPTKMDFDSMCPSTLPQDKTSFGSVTFEINDGQHYNQFRAPIDGHPGSTSAFEAAAAKKDDFEKLAVNFVARLNDYGESKDPQDSVCPPTAYFIYQVTDNQLIKILPYESVSAAPVPENSPNVADCNYSFVIDKTKFQSLIDQALQGQPQSQTDQIGTIVVSGEVCAPGQNHLWAGRLYFGYGYQAALKGQNPNLGPSPEQTFGFNGFYQWAGFKDPK